jgi:hypothetical protein
MKQDINKYIENYDICQKMTVRKYKFYRLLQSLPKSKNLWKDIFMNFITGLPPSLRKGRAFNVILAVVNQYSKITYFISITINIDISVLAKFIYNKIMKYHDILKSIISDKKFIFIFK